jgi:hypothetical protein
VQQLLNKPQWWRLLLCVGLPLLFALTLGLDSNWDLRNYHLYNPHALLHGRVADIAPAQLQSFHSPSLDLPFYLLTSLGAPPRVGMLWLALPTMLCLWLALRLRDGLAPASTSGKTIATDAALVLLVLGGAATWSTMATTINDAFVAAGILAALAIILLTPAGKHRWLFAGLVAGATAGLKLSAAFYCIALAFAALPGGDWRYTLRRLVALGLGGAIGFALTYGAWGWHLYAEHGNPFFPYYNNLFHSPDAPSLPYADERFRQHGLDLLLAPVHLLHKTSAFGELKMRDPRLLLGLIALALLWWRQRGEASPQREGLARLGMFFLAAMLLWLLQYGIYRYAIVLEQLSCVALVLALGGAVPASAPANKWRMAALWLLVVLVVSATVRPNWGRDGLPLARMGFDRPAVDRGALIVTSGWEPVGAFALGVPDEVPIVALDNTMIQPAVCTRLRARAEAMVARHPGRIWYLASSAGSEMDKGQALLTRSYGLVPAGACVPWRSVIDTALLCPQRRVSARTPCAWRR